MQVDSGINLETKYGAVKGIPAQLLGWIGILCMAGFLVFQLSTSLTTKLDKLIETNTRTAIAVERLLDRFPKMP